MYMIRIVLILIIFMLSIPSVSFSSPSISFDVLRYDFGIVSQDEKVEYIFEFVNKGDRELVIDKLSAS